MKGIRKRIADQRFLALLWKFIKAGCVDRDLFRASSEGVPQGGVISPLLSNIMLHEFDAWMERNYLNKKVRKDRWAWNFGILKQRPRSEEHTSELQSLMRISYAVFCLQKKK